MGVDSFAKLATLWAALGAALLFWVPRLEARAPKGYAVATENPDATRAALATLEAGGNAVDAAVTATLVAGISSPTSSGLGGGGFALVWVAEERRPRFFDFREAAPAELDLGAFERRPLPREERGKLVGVPGEVGGLYAIHRALGALSWHAVTEPALRVARAGFAVGPHLGRVLRAPGRFGRADAGLRALYWPGGRPLGVGRRITNVALGRTIERIASEGPRAIYEGSIARELVATVRSRGGTLTEADLARYRPVERMPLCGRWEGKDVCSAPPPSAGGLMLLEVLGEFGRAELAALDPSSGLYQHLLAEAMRGAIWDRMRAVGDPDHVVVDLGALLHPARLGARRALVDPRTTRPLAEFALPGGGTHHLVTADSRGNVVSLTTTVNHAFGAELMARSSGIVLNDELDDFTSRPDEAAFGIQDGPNRPRPGARPASNMTPTLVVQDGRVVMALGGSGGGAIATNVTQIALRRLVFGTPAAELVTSPRFYLPTAGATISVERAAPGALSRDLAARGEKVAVVPHDESAVEVVVWDAGRPTAAADPRKSGSAASE
jgi:gamma-glutamyltranspeptidase / glutathione hydrolase